ncbi:MAG: hypothetical protein FWB84_03260 [Candidatus Bathyarchaeota archaeon]|nr:hypothetical protein [Candidatus Termiticorpusculum sp.]MCL2292270.1 hypothetical protein [Candidatus Termiticorpusculum sp.]
MRSRVYTEGKIVVSRGFPLGRNVLKPTSYQTGKEFLTEHGVIHASNI